MKQLLVLIFCILSGYSVFSQGRPAQIIICVDRSLADAPAFLKGDKGIHTKALDESLATNRVCYGGPVSFTVSSFNCQSPSIASEVITLTITADSTFEIGDAFTLDDAQNLNFTDGTSALFDDFEGTEPNARVAVLSENGVDVEIEFTRDPSQESVLVLRNARLSSDGSKRIVIPACDPADLAVGAASIPTIGEWTGIILAIMMLIFGIVASTQERGTLIPVKERVKK